MDQIVQVADVPDGSVYFWMYKQGLKHVPFDQVEAAVAAKDKVLRDKDIQNYWNGWYRSDLYHGPKARSILEFDSCPRSKNAYKVFEYDEYPEHPYLDKPEIANRWVPCNEQGFPIIRWGNGCMLKSEAQAMRGCHTLAENLKGTKTIVIDIDGDHGDDIDLELIDRMWRFNEMTHVLFKDQMVMVNEDPFQAFKRYCPVSYHLTFTVDRVIPTMHFPKAKIDIIGNEKNSIRYLKRKIWNGHDPIPMTNEIWRSIMDYIKSKEEE